MGIRVDAASLESQLKERGKVELKAMPFHQAVLNEELPYTIGGGIGQSRICMFLMDKVHIGEVQVSYWSQETLDFMKENNVTLL